MIRPVLVPVVLAAALAAGCASANSTSDPAPGPSEIFPLGDHFESPVGSLFVIHVQDEYQLIRCIPSGPIAGCFDNLFSVPNGEVRYNRWLPVPKVPGLDLAIVSPHQVAFRVARAETGGPGR